MTVAKRSGTVQELREQVQAQVNRTTMMSEAKSVGKRGKKPIQIDKIEFQAVVYKIEAENKPATRSQLWQLVAETEWARSLNPRPLQAPTAMLKAEQMGIEVKTPKGKRGGSAAFVAARGKRTGPRKKKGMSEASIQAYLDKVPDRALKGDKIYNLLEQAQSGSTKACIKLNCLMCSSFQPSEVRNCTVISCPWLHKRPYQGRSGETEVQEDNVIAVAEEDLVQIS